MQKATLLSGFLRMERKLIMFYVNAQAITSEINNTPRIVYTISQGKIGVDKVEWLPSLLFVNVMQITHNFCHD
jgi:hypothetical protein